MLASDLKAGEQGRGMPDAFDDLECRDPFYNADSLTIPHVPFIEVSPPKEKQDLTADQVFVGCVSVTRSLSATPERNHSLRAAGTLSRSRSADTRLVDSSFVTFPAMDYSSGFDISHSCYACWIPEKMVPEHAAYQFTEPTLFEATFTRMDAHVMLTGDPCVGKTCLINSYTAQQLSISGTPFESSAIQGMLVSTENSNYRATFMTLHECGGGLEYCSGFLSLLAQQYTTRSSLLLCFSITGAGNLSNLLNFVSIPFKRRRPNLH